MKRRLTSLFVVLCMLTSLFAFVPATVSAADDITVILNGQKLEFDVPPQLMNDRTMVPMRAIFEALDTTVYWNESNETVSAYSSVSGTIVLPIGGTTATVNGEAYELDQPAVLKDGRTLVPIRFVAESLGATVGWDDATKTITSTKGDTTIKLTIDNPTMYVNDKAVTLDSPACLVNNRTLVPARAVAEGLGCDVGWDGGRFLVTITPKE